jgi:hypothetical protein
VQVDKLSDIHAEGTPSTSLFSSLGVGGTEDRVSGMDEYLQLRFSQGAPDKEQRFIDCVNEVAARTKHAHPTIFAWHGQLLLRHPPAHDIY